ncbi:hypothetical protein [Citrobacter sp. Marseille-Q6884]|uniref:hypothetical protein n=1 Tax=Citrobacter sp. Marseille-Q6884 TaxID=2956786 RepID=UPI0021B4237E|nr:hypothetical protein [Citrobacter sp. Marseille-Q6884]
MPLTTSAFRTYAPFDPAIRIAMCQRAYSVTVTFPDGETKRYSSLAGFTQLLGKRLEHLRTKAIYAEMDVGDSSQVNWSDKDKSVYSFQFTRIR